MPKPLVIIGNGEIAEMACEYFAYDSDRRSRRLFNRRRAHQVANSCTTDLRPAPVRIWSRTIPPDTYDAFVAIGDGQLNRLRRRHVDGCKALGYQLASYVSSRAFVWRNVEIGENFCLILEHNVLQPFTTIGDNVTLWSGNHIGHRSVVEDDVFMSSHVVVLQAFAGSARAVSLGSMPGGGAPGRDLRRTTSSRWARSSPRRPRSTFDLPGQSGRAPRDLGQALLPRPGLAGWRSGATGRRWRGPGTPSTPGRPAAISCSIDASWTTTRTASRMRRCLSKPAARRSRCCR